MFLIKQTGGNQNATLSASMKIATYNINGVNGRLTKLTFGGMSFFRHSAVMLRQAPFAELSGISVH